MPIIYSLIHQTPEITNMTSREETWIQALKEFNKRVDLDEWMKHMDLMTLWLKKSNSGAAASKPFTSDACGLCCA